MKLALPWPPSVNTYYRNLGHRVLISREGRAFRTHCVGAVWSQLAGANGGPRKPPAGGRIALLMDAFPPDRRKRDLDNLSKGVLDSLQHAGVFLDDSQIDILLTRRRDVVPGGRLDVEVLDLPLCKCPLCGAGIPSNPSEN